MFTHCFFFHCRQLPRINNFRRVEPTTASFPPYQQPLERNISQPNRSPARMYGYDNIQQEQPSHIPYVLYVVKMSRSSVNVIFLLLEIPSSNPIIVPNTILIGCSSLISYRVISGVDSICLYS